MPLLYLTMVVVTGLAVILILYEYRKNLLWCLIYLSCAVAGIIIGLLSLLKEE
jgi:hypothetical protein